jgi:excinuclease ABC subunit C
MLSEVMERQYRENPLPDLLVIDGGPLQLDACVRTLEDMGHHDASRRVVSLAKERTNKNKSERIFFPGQENPLILPGHHPVTHLLVRLRDEAHRFAIKYHRTLREEYLTHSRLLNIPGVGPAREKKLLQSFGSVKNLMEATIEDIVQNTGLSVALSTSIYQSLRDNQDDPIGKSGSSS